MRCLFSIALCLLLTAAASHQLLAGENGGHEHTTTDILLPIERADLVPHYLQPAETQKAHLWEQFNARYGDWTIMLDPLTLNARQAFGKPIQLDIADVENLDAVKQAALDFLRAQNEVLNIDADNLSYFRATPVGSGASKKVYLSLRQQFHGLNVLHSEAELRINSRGQLFAMRFNTFPALDVNTQPTLAQKDVFNAALEGLGHSDAPQLRFDVDPASVELSVLPIVGRKGVEYRLVYGMNISSNHPGLRYEALVDAHNGDLLRRVSTALHVESNVKVTADVRTGLRTAPTQSVPLSNLYVEVGEQQLLTDADGNVTVDLAEDTDLTLELEGPYIEVYSMGRERGSNQSRLTAGQDGTLHWEDENSHIFERNMFYHGNVVHDWLKQIDQEATALDIPVVVQLWYESDPFGGVLGGTVNAFSNLDTIAFIGLADGSMRMADGGSVLYHEYGHSINNLFAMSLGGSFTNSTAQEGISDVVAAFVEDQPRVGLGVFVEDPNRSIRNADNELQYPYDITGESHHDGQIISGAFWDLRQLTSLETATHLMHFARYGLPEDLNVGAVFNEWFVEVLVADDDDGDLSNGTPHCDEILQAFNKHNIGTHLFRLNTFSHTPLANTDDTVNDYAVDFSFSRINLKVTGADVVRINYFTNRNPQTVEVEAVNLSDDNWQAFIPAQPTGTQVSYSIQVRNPDDTEFQTFTGNGSVDGYYTFLVGYQVVVAENFNDASDWTLGEPDDDALIGHWEIGDPQRIYLPDFDVPLEYELQPEDDFSEVGVNCLVTGAIVPPDNFGAATVIAGKTTVTSPVYDISGYESPIVEFAYWFVQLVNSGEPDTEPDFRVEVTGNGGESWSTLYNTVEAQDYWRIFRALLPQEVADGGQFRIRFIVDATAAGFSGFGNGLVDDFTILVPRGSTGTSVGEDVKLPFSFVVSPNPAREACTLHLNMERAGSATAELVDMRGNAVLELSPQMLYSGEHELELQLNDNTGRALTPGLYFVRVSIDGKDLTQKLIVR